MSVLLDFQLIRNAEYKLLIKKFNILKNTKVKLPFDSRSTAKCDIKLVSLIVFRASKNHSYESLRVNNLLEEKCA